MPVGDPVAGLVEVDRADHERHDASAPLVVRHAEHLGGEHIRVLAKSGGHRRRRDIDATAHDHVVDAAQHLQPPVLVEPPGVGGEEPTVDEDRGGQLGITVVPVEERRPTDPQTSGRLDRERDAVQGHAVVDTTTGGFGTAVGTDDPDPGGAGAFAQRGGDRATAEEHGVEGTQRVEILGVVEHPVQLGRHQRHEPVSRHCLDRLTQ